MMASTLRWQFPIARSRIIALMPINDSTYTYTDYDIILEDF